MLVWFYLAIVGSFIPLLEELDFQGPFRGFRRMFHPESRIRRVSQQAGGENVPVPQSDPRHLVTE